IMIEECNGHWQTAELEYPYGRGINFQIEVENIESILKNLKRHKITLFRELMLNVNNDSNFPNFNEMKFPIMNG
ncbi:hypothetical protein KZ309_27255, partial [Escherichia coli]|nr:hypothetical protein [Escherichia coli]